MSHSGSIILAIIWKCCNNLEKSLITRGFWFLCWKSLSCVHQALLAVLPRCVGNWNRCYISSVPLCSVSVPTVPPLWPSLSCEQLVNETFWFVLKPDTNIQCSVSSEDIEKSFKTNPCGSISFTTSKFSYKIDFAGMFFSLMVVCS